MPSLPVTLRALVLSALWASAAFGQEAKLPAGAEIVSDNGVPVPPRPLAKGRVTGHVICNDTRQPARGAMVMLEPIPSNDKNKGQDADGRPGGMLSARVALDGSYDIEHVPRGDYGVLAFLPGYLSAVDDLVITESDKDEQAMMNKRLSAQGVAHVPANGSASFDVTLERGATLAGRVLYADGSPASQVNISVESATAVAKTKPGEASLNVGAMMRAVFTHQTTGTDDQGHFRISGIHPGTYRVAAVEPMGLSDDTMGSDGGMAFVMAMGMGGSEGSSARRYYAGDTIHRKAAKTFELRAGDTIADLDIRLPIDGFRSVRVRLAATDGRAITRAAVMLTDNADDTLTFAATNHLDGLFEIKGVPPGTYSIAVTKPMIAGPFGEPAAAFADGSSSVIVKETDGSEIALSLKEIPLPKQPAPTGDPD